MKKFGLVILMPFEQVAKSFKPKSIPIDVSPLDFTIVALSTTKQTYQRPRLSSANVPVLTLYLDKP